MRKEIYHHAWHKLTNQEMSKLFDDTFGSGLKPFNGGTQVCVLPNLGIVKELHKLKSGTIELIEDRSSSTVYRIKQTGTVYQISKPHLGKCFIYSSYDHYHSKGWLNLIDNSVQMFDVDQLKFTAKTDDHGQLWIYHHEHPNFKARYVKGELSNFDSFEPDDVFNKLDVAEAAKLMRKAGAFLMSYFKTQTK